MTERFKKILMSTLLVAGITLGPASAAEQPQLSLRADKNRVGVDDTIELELSVSGPGSTSAGEPVIEGMEHFEQLGTTHGDQLSIINMNITRSTTWRYTLRPKKAGESVTLRAKVPVRGTNYLSGTVTIETVTGGGRPSPHPPGMFTLPPGTFNFPAPFSPPPGARPDREDDFILQANVAPTSVYAGEEAVYTLSFYQGNDVFSNVNFAPPTLKNFWVEQPDDPQRHESKQTRLGGRDYTLTEVRTLLYPMTPGDAQIPPATVSFQASPFSPTVLLESNKLTLKVKPLPEKGKPAGFSGLVGSFSIDSAVAQKSAAVGQPFTLTVTVSGRGALHAIPKPEEPAFDAERYDPEVKDVFHRGMRGNEGSRTFSYIIVPKKEGTLVIPPFSLAFFNPQSATYETVKSAQLTLAVSAAAAVQPAPAAPAAALPDKPSAPVKETPLNRQPFIYAILAILLAAAAAITFFNRRRNARKNHATERKAALAAKAQAAALERLARAEKLLHQNDTATFLGEVEHAIRNYLSDKLNVPPAVVTPDALAHRLPAETLARHQHCISVLRACFEARYSPGIIESPASLLEQAKKAVAEKP